jgi:general stress protein 26
MSHTDDERETAELSRLLSGAAQMISRVRYCWLLTEAQGGGADARPMGRVQPSVGDADWNVRFVTDGRSRKASAIRRAGKVELIFQHDASEAFVTLTGRASLVEQPSQVSRLWKSAYDIYFPGEDDRASAAFVEIHVERMELWIRGVTPEPFGLQTTTLERDARGAWRLSDR